MEECILRSFVPVLFILCLQACAGVALAEPSTATTQVEKLLSSGRYQLIDQMEKEIRASKQVDDEDRPALSVLYRALAGVNLGSDAAWRARRQLLEKWRDADGDSFIPKLVLANHYYYYAWWLRSTQVGPKLSRAQVDGFRANLRESFWLASSITFSADDDPAWWELMLWLGVAQGWPKLLFNQTYSHAVALRPDYFLYHLAKAQYVSARWYGSREEFVAYVDAVTEKYGKDFGDRLYGRLQWNLRLPNMFDSGQASWPKTRQSYEAIVKAWPTRRNNKEFAELACMAKDWKFAANSIAAMDPPVTVDEKNGLYLRQCKREADGYNAVAIKRPAEAPAITNAATKKSSPVPAHWAQPEANEQDVPAEKEHVSDAAEIAAVAGDKVPYEKQRNAVLDVAKRNPAIISMIDARKIRLLEKDLAQVILLVAT
ncbi:MAG TPA: hypothetical protein VJ998_10680, partial [Pseudomonadales bacterium]|nr:hypothetical protein [Pseudomonadales bacterium]